jgi:hypothetical protein
MSGLTMTNPQNNLIREKYNQIVRNKINFENKFNTGEPDRTVMSFGALFGQRQLMDEITALNNFNSNLRYENLYIGSGMPDERIHIDINSHNDESDEDKEGGEMISSKDFDRSIGGKLPKITGTDILNYNSGEIVENVGANVGGRAKLKNRTPSTSGGFGVQSWTEYPNKSLSKRDIVEATATKRDLDNKMVQNYDLNIDNIAEELIKKSKGGRKFSHRACKCGMKKKTGGWAFLAPLAMSVASSLVPKLVDKVGSWIGLGKSTDCGGLKKIIENDLIDLKGGSVASPDIDEGLRAPINSGIGQATQIDGFQTPGAYGIGGSKKRSRKPMSDEQKKLFVQKMKEAKARRRIQ